MSLGVLSIACHEGAQEHTGELPENGLQVTGRRWLESLTNLLVGFHTNQSDMMVSVLLYSRQMARHSLNTSKLARKVRKPAVARTNRLLRFRNRLQV